ncbi:hypothetical protein SAMN05421665_1728 [Yoonia rosea]|uniref:Sensory transduction regulator n=1 Tax=Yoonia rosea TaxID=287098 RepID=A0A1R3X1N3_9RHOB|nr:hypothetical protein [Yoonia rosea]SIT83776.1 hypothetical protein SAMN05421665_1728 [Yoonia rosea]
MIRILIAIAFFLPAAAQSQEAEPHMTLPRMAEIVLALDPEAELVGAGFSLTIDDIPVLIVTDVAANRMRAMVPIRSAETMTSEEMRRVMQANFDSALDARYAVAGGQLWGVFLHPFKELERNQFISGVAQTVNVAKTYGSLYSSGAGQFGAGDSGDLQRELIERLLEKGQDI